MTENKTDGKKDILNLPNILTICRIIMIPVFVLFFYVHFTGHYFVAWAVFAMAAVTDLLDGHIARKYNLVTNLGKFLDPIADKILVLSAFVILLTKQHVFTAYLGEWVLIVAGCGVALIIAREMMVSGLRMVAASSGQVIAADKIGKYKTFSQDICIGFLIVGEGIFELTDHIFGKIVNYIGLGIFVIAILLTVISGINYLVKNIEVLKK